jgi:FMN hydrolase / 5-amino-6-(5-phospho-D-ribitylamino)uracil phosphatase
LKALGFDFGQTLAELDLEFLKRRLAQRGVTLDAEAAGEGAQRAWQLYGERKRAGHAVAWRGMMETMLESGGVAPATAVELSGWLWDEQPKQNLWRKPIPGMIELVRDLKSRGIPVAVISNSEGRLAELVAELNWSDAFDVVVDSGRLGIDKPDPRIFAHAGEALAVSLGDLLHVGDSWEADVLGAVAAGASAVWFDGRHRARALPENVHGAGSATELTEVLARLGFLR